MRTLLIGLAMLVSTLVVSPGKLDKANTTPKPKTITLDCPLYCTDEVICPDGRIYCNPCLARQHKQKNCVPYNG